MFFDRFFSRISDLIGGAAIPANAAAALAHLNPDKFYVENVRSVLGISTPRARRLCETAVRQGLFEKGVEVRCPDGAVAVTASTTEALPQVVRCVQETNGHYEEHEFRTANLETMTFYRLHDEQSAAGILRPTT